MMIKPRATYLYATRADMEPGLNAVEGQKALQYVRRGLFESPQVQVVSSALEIPDLGFARVGDLILANRYLVLDASLEVKIREVPQRRGGVRYAIDEVANPTGMIFVPGGLYEGREDRYLIVGEVVATGDPRSHELYRLFVPLLVKGFTKIKSYYVGPEALRLLREGVRLTHSAGPTPSYELRE
jgi:hypothetical protein